MEHAPDDYRGHDSQTDKPVMYCRHCGGEIYKTDTRYQWDSEECDICEECFSDKVIEKLTQSPELIADAMGLKVERGT
ncbi:MAG: hypothetical protein Q8873_00415 [Bacillota bacterium]|nr:hypothetical protein [Bacillota bacterium]